MAEFVFKNKRLITDKLIPFGFILDGDIYYYNTEILDGQFLMSVTVNCDGKIDTKLIDTAGDEEYVLHLIPDSQGKFIGQIREEYEKVLERISDICFETEIFKSKQSKKLIEYVREKYGDELEFLWAKFPDNAIWRRKDTSKWYAALLTVSKNKLSIKSDEIVEIINLRMKPEELKKIVDNELYFPGWHMNKKNWITIILDGSVSFDEICRRLDESYKLAVK